MEEAGIGDKRGFNDEELPEEYLDPAEVVAAERRQAKKVRRDKANRDPALDWRCPDCTWINWREFSNEICHSCGRPKPSPKDLLAIEADKKARYEARKVRHLRGGAEEAKVREDMAGELKEATTFLERTMEKEGTLSARLEKYRERVCHLS